MEFFRPVFRACCLHGQQIRFLLSVRPEDAKRKCGPGLHWLDKRVTTSPVFLYDGETFCSGREENCNNAEAVISLPLPFRLQFFQAIKYKGDEV